MKKIIHLALGLLVLSVAPWVYSNPSSDRVGELCSSCTTVAAAQQRVRIFAPVIHCDWSEGVSQPPRCRSKDREVLLINPHTEAIYSYRLIFNPGSNSHELEEWTLSTDEKGAAETILEIHQALMSFDFSHLVEGHEFETHGRFDSRGEDCPKGTALDHVLNPGLRQWMTDQIQNNWMSVMQAFGQREPRVSRPTGISASFGSVRLNVRWDQGDPPIQEVFRAGFVFPESEVDTSPPFHDQITFDIHEFHQMAMNIGMDFEFNEGLSRAAGYAVNLLFTGQAVIDNPCVQQNLHEYQQSRPDLYFTVGGPGGPLFDFPTSDPLEDLCTKLLCATCVGGHCSCQFKVSVLTPCR